MCVRALSAIAEMCTNVPLSNTFPTSFLSKRFVMVAFKYVFQQKVDRAIRFSLSVDPSVCVHHIRLLENKVRPESRMHEVGCYMGRG